MAYSSFTEFLAALERAGELRRIPFPVATELEITELADREMKSPGGGQALLFEQPTVNGIVSPFPLAINTMGSRRRMALALGLDSVQQLADRMALILKAKPPTSLKSAWKLAMQGLDLLNARPKHVGSGPCQEVVHRFPASRGEKAAFTEGIDSLPPRPSEPGEVILPTTGGGPPASPRPAPQAAPPGPAGRQADPGGPPPPAPQAASPIPAGSLTGRAASAGAGFAAAPLPTLLDLPILQCWPQDGGRFITLPCVHTRDPDSGERNLGMYRMQVYDGQTTGMHWQVHKVGARHGKRYYERGERMPVAVTIGGDPAYTFAATAPLPDGLDEILFAGFIRKKPVELVKCVSVDLEVPADVDIVIEGYVQPGELRAEGPFGDHTGFYTPLDAYPLLHVTAITHRRGAVYPCTIVGIPPMEDFYMGTASVAIFLPVFRMNFPEIVDLALPAEGVFHNLVFVSIRKQYAWQAYKIMHGLWGMGQMMFSKYIVVVDEDCDVHDTSAVLFRWMANTDPQRDSTFIKSPCDALDHAQTVATMGTHMGFDATRKLPTEGYGRAWPELLAMPAEVKARVDALLATVPPGR